VSQIGAQATPTRNIGFVRTQDAIQFLL